MRAGTLERGFAARGRRDEGRIAPRQTLCRSLGAGFLVELFRKLADSRRKGRNGCYELIAALHRLGKHVAPLILRRKLPKVPGRSQAEQKRFILSRRWQAG